jgi:hypothetical protein
MKTLVKMVLVALFVANLAHASSTTTTPTASSNAPATSSSAADGSMTDSSADQGDTSN